MPETMVHFITYKNTRILHIDLAGLDKDSVLSTLQQARNIIDQQPEHSLLTLLVISGRRNLALFDDLETARKWLSSH